MNSSLINLLMFASKKACQIFLIQVIATQLLLAGESNSQNLADVRLNFEIEEAKLEETFSKLESATQFKFGYNKAVLNSKIRFSMNEKNVSVEKILLKVSKEANLKFKRINNQILVLKDNGKDASQNKIIVVEDVDISGRITDENGEGLPGASVLVKGTSIGSTSDIEGKYQLSIADDAVLTISFVGYMTQEVSIAGRTTIDIQMELDATQLDELVVVGYGTSKRGDVTDAITSVSTNDFDRIPATTPLQILQGRAAGIQISSESGLPGSSSDVLVRGVQSINGTNTPIFVVNGVITTSIDNLNPNTIESVSILKDASAAAIYGSRAANGVILITTKRGTGKGEPEITFNSYYGVQTESNLKIELLNADQFVELWTESYTNAGLDLPWDSQVLSYYDGVDTDWLDLVTQTGVIQNYDLSVAGGSEKSNYFVSAGYLDQKGMVIETGFKKLTLSFNSDHKVTNRIKFGNSLNIFSSTQEGSGDNYRLALQKPPVTRMFEDGTNDYAKLFNSNLEHIYSNPVYLAKNSVLQTNQKGLQGNIFLTVDLLEGLDFTARGSIDYLDKRRTQFTPSVDPIYGWEGSTINLTSKAHEENVHWISDYLLNYTTTINEVHNIKGLLGYSREENTNETLRGSRSGTPADYIRYLTAGDPSSQTNDNDYSDWAFTSIFGRVNYNYDNRFYLTATVRRDGTSRLSKDNRFGVFPSASLAWRISREKFLQNVNFISDMKIRASYGKLGNILSISSYGTSATLSSRNSSINNLQAQGITLTSAVNEDLKWESVSKKDIGLDVEMMNGKLYSTFDYFVEDTYDLIFSDPIPTSTGLNGTPKINAAEVRNTGWEMQIGYKTHKSDWYYDVNFNMTHVKNEVTDLKGRDLRTSGLVEGYPVESFFGYKSDGIITDASQLSLYESGGFTTKEVGDIALLDIDGHDEEGELTGVPDGQVDSADRTIIGNRYPNLVYGLLGTVNYKNWGLQVQFQGVQGVDKKLQVGDFSNLITLMSSSARNEDARILNRYDAVNNPNGTWPKLSKDQAGSNDTFSEFWIFDASYLRVKNINLNYNVSKNFCSKLNMSQLGFYVSVQNAFTFTNYDGPEVDTLSDPLTGVPQPRTWILGVKATF
ncbi:TonB-dependent receptor [Reichenbachiella sp. MALMAid0571]|uniref:SusC/RagA family TonB-linked outer membrane protein n=1 Tax=Reichenbachiella sp. MALMAid0571 TaxID=3143939 RepID=UPI0032DE507B